MIGEYTRSIAPRVGALRANQDVLIIEDSADTCDLLAITLARAGYRVKAVNCRDEALDVLKDMGSPRILMDYFMPGMPAGEFLDAVRKGSLASQVVLMTAAGVAYEKCKELSLKLCLCKPFTQEEVLIVLKLSEDLSNSSST